MGSDLHPCVRLYHLLEFRACTCWLRHEGQDSYRFELHTWETEATCAGNSSHQRKRSLDLVSPITKIAVVCPGIGDIQRHMLWVQVEYLVLHAETAAEGLSADILSSSRHTKVERGVVPRNIASRIDDRSYFVQRQRARHFFVRAKRAG